MIDIALVEEAGRLVVHRARCPLVRQLAADGVPVATLFGCESVPEGLPRHACMDEDR